MHGLRGYWDAPIFFPESGAFAFSDPQPATMLVAPWLWVTHSPVIAYDVYLWLGLFLNGLTAAVCFRCLRVGWPLTVGGSTAILFLPIVWDNVDVLQLVPLWGVVLTTVAIMWFERRPSALRAAAAGLAVASVFFTSVHHGLFLVVSLMPACLGLRPWRYSRLYWMRAAVGGLLCAAMITPVVLPMARVHARQHFRRARATQTELSATLNDWTHVPHRALIGPRAETVTARALNPGVTRCALATAGVLAIVGRRQRRRLSRDTFFWLTFGATACALSFGMNLALGPWKLWPFVAQVVPPLDSARSLFRFAYFTQLSVVVLATLGADVLVGWLKPRTDSTGRLLDKVPMQRQRLVVGRGLVVGTGLALSLVLAIEVPPPPLRLVGVPDTRRAAEWITLLREEGPTNPIVCLPFATDLSESGLESSARSMLLATEHGRPLLNGYSGFFPASWYENVSRFQSQRWTDELARFLYDTGVHTIVVDTRSKTSPPLLKKSFQVGEFRFELVLAADDGTEVWRLKGPGR